MLPLNRRLNLRRKPQGSKQVFPSDSFNLELINIADDQPTRFAVVVSKKVAKKAVQRNRLRRQLHSAFRRIASHVKPGFGVIIYVRPGALELGYAQIQTSINHLLKQASVLTL